MIRKLLFLTLLLLPSLALGAPARDILLTPSGTLYSVESVDPDTLDGVESTSVRVLQLTVRNGGEVIRQIVPSTLAGAAHVKPALAYDAESDTLFIFWQKSINAMSSELLFCSYSNGAWSEPTAIDRSSYNVRFGLKIASTAYAASDAEEGEAERVKLLTIHAIWWEQTGYGEEARYAMLSLHDGKVIQTDLRRLIDFTSGTRNEIPAELDADFDRSIFRAPSIATNAGSDSVDVIFADWDRNRMHRVTVRPVLNHGVIRIPDGKSRGEIGAPRGRIAGTSAGEIEMIHAPAADTLAIYGVDGSEVRYTLHRNGEWSPVRALPVSAEVPAEAVIGAIRRLATSD